MVLSTFAVYAATSISLGSAIRGGKIIADVLVPAVVPEVVCVLVRVELSGVAALVLVEAMVLAIVVVLTTLVVLLIVVDVLLRVEVLVVLVVDVELVLVVAAIGSQNI